MKPETLSYTLVSRVCKCGCKKTFRTLPNSPSFYASIRHNPQWLLAQGWGIDHLLEREEKLLEAVKETETDET